MWAWVPGVVAIKSFAFEDDSDADPDDDLFESPKPEYDEYILDVDPDEDPYDPSKPEYVLPAGPRQVEAQQLRLLLQQASRLEHFLAGPWARHLAPDVALHYQRVLSDLRCSLKELRAEVARGPPGAPTQDSAYCQHDGKGGGLLDAETSHPAWSTAAQPPQAVPPRSAQEERLAETEPSAWQEQLSPWDAVPDARQIHVSEFAGQGLSSWTSVRPHNDWAHPDRKTPKLPSGLSLSLLLLSQAWQSAY